MNESRQFLQYMRSCLCKLPIFPAGYSLLVSPHMVPENATTYCVYRKRDTGFYSLCPYFLRIVRNLKTTLRIFSFCVKLV